MLVSDYKNENLLLNLNKKTAAAAAVIQYLHILFIQMLFHFKLDRDLNNEQIFSSPAPPYSKRCFICNRLFHFRKQIQLH